MTEGRIVKLTGGFYYVDIGGKVIECRARGLFRKDNIKPCVGDIAKVEMTDGDKGYLMDILLRRNFLVRPPVANIDRIILVLSTADPAPNMLVIDKLLAVAQHKEIDVAIVVTKRDIADSTQLREIYEKSGYEVCVVNSLSDSMSEVIPLMKDRLCVLAGNTGVGKSTLLNAINPSFSLQTGEISQKLGRGRHTTRTVEIFEWGGSLIADTPGFSSIETIQLDRIKKEQLEWCFREFEPYIGECRFSGCSHTKEKDCAVLEALEEGVISKSRHDSYLAMYDEAKNLNDWEDLK